MEDRGGVWLQVNDVYWLLQGSWTYELPAGMLLWTRPIQARKTPNLERKMDAVPPLTEEILAINNCGEKNIRFL